MEFEAVINLYYEDLYRFAFSLARTRDEACDLTQQTYAIYAEKGWQVRDSAKVKNWLFTTLYREFLQTREDGLRLESMDDDATKPPEQIAPSDTERSAEHNELVEIVISLDQTHREILTLFYLRQHTYKDIAGILGIPIGTVMSRLSRAKDVLRRRLNATGKVDGIKAIPFASNKERAARNG
jgi:RNA polymerase sigma-70 factor (ECF subfamily)